MKISKDKVVVVTGDPRSGTSLMMQTLNRLGIPISGDEFPVRTKNPDQAEKARNLNPRGYFEVPGVTMRGFQDIGEYGGTAIKIMVPGLMMTPPQYIQKGIICLRNPRDVAESQTNLIKNIEIRVSDGEWKMPASPKRYVFEMGRFVGWWREQSQDFKDRFLVVDYDEFVNDPASMVDRIVAHLGIKVSKTKINTAVENVDPKLRRSDKVVKDWTEDNVDYGMISDNIYQSLKTGDDAMQLLVSTEIQSKLDLERRERALIYMPEIQMNATATFLRQYRTLETIRTAMSQFYRGRVVNGYGFETSPDYSGESEETYTIELPIDLGGDIKSHKVFYNGLILTKEQAQIEHERRRADGNKRTDDVKVRLLLGD